MDWRGRHTLVTGGTGFVGSFLAEALLARGARVSVPSRTQSSGFLDAVADRIAWLHGDLRDRAFCTSLCERVDVLFHLASHRKNVAYHRDHAEEIFADNVAMTSALIEGLRARNVACPVVFISTASAGEADLKTRMVNGVFDGYIVGKVACEELWQESARERGFALLILRPVNVYGPRDRFADDGNVIPALIARAHNAHDTLTVWGSGAQERSFVYVEDLVAAMLQLLDVGVTGIVPVAAPCTVSIRSLAERIRDDVAPGLRLQFDTSKPEGVRRFPSASLHPALHGFPWTPLRDGLRRTFDWWQQSLYDFRND